MLVVLLVQ